jgi:hypothetical protein
MSLETREIRASTTPKRQKYDASAEVTASTLPQTHEDMAKYQREWLRVTGSILEHTPNRMQHNPTSSELVILNAIDRTEHTIVNGKVQEQRVWENYALELDNPNHREFAARALALGAGLIHGFGNFYAFTAHPLEESVVRINRIKGRKDDQPGSITTDKTHRNMMFDWDQVLKQVHEANPNIDPQEVVYKIRELMDHSYELGPFGWRGPAASRIENHLTQLDPITGTATTQIIASGDACPSNEIITRAMELAGTDHLFITSVNKSSRITGNEEAPHYEMNGAQVDFGAFPGTLMVRHNDEVGVRAKYADFDPRSTSIGGFHNIKFVDGIFQLPIERHGSYPEEKQKKLYADHGFGFYRTERANHRLPQRVYTVE